MNATAITEEDIKLLQKSQSRAVRLTKLIVLPFIVVVFVVCGMANLYLCSLWSHLAGMSMGQVIRCWFSDIRSIADVCRHVSEGTGEVGRCHYRACCGGFRCLDVRDCSKSAKAKRSDSEVH